MFKPLFIAAVLPALAVVAQVGPTEPAPGDSFNEGASCTIDWTVDTTGQWTTLNIELMTGSNEDMEHLTTVATVDGTKQSSFSYTCPQVTPNSAIYFYQFSTPAAPSNKTWTGRFSIADTNGKTTDPTETTDGIQWGTGKLLDASSTTPAPSYLAQDPSSSTSSGLASGSAAATTIPPTAAVSSTAGSSTASSSSSTSSIGTSSITSVSGRVVSSNTPGSSSTLRSSSTSGSSAPSSAPASSSTSGAAMLVPNLQARSMQAFAGLACTAIVFATLF
ncbi:hypothetical protein EW145_g242 [Phellinidium pouzarii]|uniref:Yeast cell wall synthesis Kre9/Knh1-like N-terminal domain-containing protein n=1 Tax=Phellinidium pouzarii TaxID=167371 RepID=A0A4S4LJ49_9AGAM|nr:hypothetical protein EW145_g242 [Phellinidium pouzarii]